MKRNILALALSALLLTGCGTAAADSAPVQTGNQIPAAQVMPLPDLQYRVELKTFEHTSYDEADGAVLATYRAQVPVMTVLLSDGTQLTEAETAGGQRALEIAETFNSQFDPWTEEEDFNALTEDARAAKKTLEADGYTMVGNYAKDLSCTVYQTEHLISVSGLCYSYTGGAHPNSWQMAWNFDLKNGTFFAGEALATDNAAFRDAVTQELLVQARENARDNGMTAEELYMPGYEELLADWGSYTVYFDDSGMTVAYSPYELAPYAAGTQEFRLGYEWMAPRLSKRGCEILELECSED